MHCLGYSFFYVPCKHNSCQVGEAVIIVKGRVAKVFGALHSSLTQPNSFDGSENRFSHSFPFILSLLKLKINYNSINSVLFEAFSSHGLKIALQWRRTAAEFYPSTLLLSVIFSFISINSVPNTDCFELDQQFSVFKCSFVELLVIQMKTQTSLL